ncbi:zinc ribbon domain-containing protein [Limnoglobus roseus]|uniref:Zinc finger/thioredoxin putative domain-containing protein n=1 Tax=Limnoglobus roseus TaxID=2598579 RepID=A0A5C1A608_9BACT|nr:hypothetical protein [Limnoglobus roseus]QEL13773.1 hypothetical protein PX52LOC_00631 [Limnoglobus roseus]
MSIEVACPNCQARLKAPDEKAGKKARCKKCQHAFRLPGSKPNADDSDGDPEHLSAVADAPFAFGGDVAVAAPPPPAKPAAKKSAPLPEGSNPFAVPNGLSPAKAEPKKADSKSKYRTKAAEPAAKGSSYRDRKPTPDGRGKSRRLMLVLAGLLCAGGGAAAVYAFGEFQKSKDQPKPAAQAQTPAPPNDPPAPEKPADTPAAGKAAKDAPPRARKTTGGLTLPPPNPTPVLFEKATTVLALDHAPAAVKQMLVGGTDGPVMLVMRRTFDGIGGKGMRDTIDRYALNSQRRIDQTEVPVDTATAYPRVCAVSPGGDRFAIEHPAGKLTVAQLGTTTNVVEGLAPGDAKEPDAATAGIAGVRFLTDEKVAVLTKTGVVEVWDLAAKKRVSVSEPLPGGTPLVEGRTFVFHDDRDPKKASVFAYAGGGIHQVVVGGKPRPVFTLPRQSKACLALAVEDGGTRLAIAYTAAEPIEHVWLVCGRVNDKKPSGDHALDAEVGSPVAAGWTRSETFSILTDKGQGFAYAADTNDVIAVFRPEKPGPLLAPDDTRQWCLLSDPADAKKAVLVNVTVPPESYSPSLTGEKWTPLALTITPQGTAK